MRILTLIAAMVAATGASAAEVDARHADSDAVTAQLVYRVGFGATHGAPAARGFALQVGNEGQRLAGVAPLRAEYVWDGRQDSGRFLLNGMDVERTFVMKQEEGGIGAVWGGWVPLIVVIGAASLIVVDGQDQDLSGTGASGN